MKQEKRKEQKYSKKWKGKDKQKVRKKHKE